MSNATASPKSLTGKDRAAAKRQQALAKIEAAQTLLYEAAQLACPLQGWAKQWEKIGDHADATQALWKEIAYGPHPTGHDGF